MKHTSFSYDVSATVEFSGAELLILYRASRNHYDALCKSVSQPGEKAFLWGTINRFSYGDEKEKRYDEIWQEETKPHQRGTIGYASAVQKAVGSFLREFSEETVTTTLTSREVDTLNKILEMSYHRSYQNDEAAETLTAALVTQMHCAFQCIQDEWERLEEKQKHKIAAGFLPGKRLPLT
jgi:hypothetical protein